jgi:hypothetical protein
VATAPVERGIPRFRAAWTNGERTTETLSGWDQANPELELQGQPLASAEKSVRWLRSTRIVSKPAAAPGVYFVGGDFLPGEVVIHAPATATMTAAGEAPLVAVKPSATVDAPGLPHRDTVLVSASSIRKIVWQSRGRDDDQPQTAFLRDGRSLRFRNFHWTATGVRLLQEDRVEAVPLEELAELHLPNQDAWSAYVRRLADLSPDCRGNIVEIESTGGLRVTTSWQRLRPWLAAAEHGGKQAVCVVQPAWALDGLCLPIAELQRLTFFEPEEMPLTMFDAVHDEHLGYAFAGQLPWRRVASRLDTAPFSGGRDFAWGLKVQGEQQLDFLLPSAATRLQTHIGLDAKAGEGGAARGRIELRLPESDATPAIEMANSPPFASSRTPPARLDLKLKNPRPAGAVVRLGVDPLVEHRPVAADPLEIRDFVDWLEPLVIIDRRQLAGAVRSQWPAAPLALAGWSLDGDWQPQSAWRPGGRPVPGFRREIVLGGEPFRITRTLSVTGERNHLVIRASRLAGKSSPIEMRLLLDGRPQASRSVPIDEQVDDPPPIVVDLSTLAGRTTNVELEFRSSGRPASFEIQSVALEPSSTSPTKP